MGCSSRRPYTFCAQRQSNSRQGPRSFSERTRPMATSPPRNRLGGPGAEPIAVLPFPRPTAVRKYGCATGRLPRWLPGRASWRGTRSTRYRRPVPFRIPHPSVKCRRERSLTGLLKGAEFLRDPRLRRGQPTTDGSTSDGELRKDRATGPRRPDRFLDAQGLDYASETLAVDLVSIPHQVVGWAGFLVRRSPDPANHRAGDHRFSTGVSDEGEPG